MNNYVGVKITEIDDGFLIEADWFWNENETRFRETAEEAVKCAKELIDKIYEECWKVVESPRAKEE